MLKIANFIMDAVAPRQCAGCHKIKEILCLSCLNSSFKIGVSCVFCNFRNNTGQICKECRKKYEPEFEQVFWAGEYTNALKSAIWELKFGKRKELIGPLAELLYKKFAEFYGKSKTENFIVIPIPMHPKKKHKRGFNQAELIAKEFAKLSGIDIAANLLIKTKETQTQVETKTKEERIKNLEGAFSVYDPNRVWGNRTIILIDDVATTGATFIHASRTLKKAGAQKIICLAIAHGYG